MEAELFAAERCRPAPSGRALLCAANYAREIQGLTASQKRTDARNRAPVTPVSLHISDVSAQRRVWGSQEGAREPYGALAPFCLRRETPAPPRRRAAASLSAGRPRQSPAARCERGRYRQAVQLSDHFLPVFLSTLAFFANLRKWFAYFDCFARFSKKFLLQK